MICAKNGDSGGLMRVMSKNKLQAMCKNLNAGGGMNYEELKRISWREWGRRGLK